MEAERWWRHGPKVGRAGAGSSGTMASFVALYRRIGSRVGGAGYGWHGPLSVDSVVVGGGGGGVSSASI